MAIRKTLWFAAIILLLPAGLLTAFVLHQLLFASADARFWVLFLLSLAPCGLLACVLSVLDIWRRKRASSLLRFTNLATLLVVSVGVVELIGGVMSIGLVLLVIGALR